MIDLGAHGMYLTQWILGEPISAKSTFTICNQNPGAAKKNVDGVEDNAVTVMSFESGAIAVNETGFVSCCSPVIFEVHGDKGYVYMENNRGGKKNKSKKLFLEMDICWTTGEIMFAEDVPAIRYFSGTRWKDKRRSSE